MDKTTRRLIATAALMALALACACSGNRPVEAPSTPDATSPARPQRVVVIVIDQMRPDYLSRFDVPNLNGLRARGVTFENAIVGHLAAETVVSHAVLGMGLLPRHLPWGDEVMRDTAGLLGEPGLLHLPGSLTSDQIEQLLCAVPQQRDDYGGTLSQVAHEQLGGSVFAVGQKRYAVASMGACAATSLIFFGSPIQDGPDAGWAGPAGRGFPEEWGYLPDGQRFFVDAHLTFGTDQLEYPLKGHEVIPTEEDTGGDFWAIDLAIEQARRDPSWSALLITISAVDAVGHAVSGQQGQVDLGQDPRATLENVVPAADRAIGRLLAFLQQEGTLDETLIVITADHGATTGTFLGDEGPGRGHPNWYVGQAVEGSFDAPSRNLAPVMALDEVGFIMADCAIRVWLDDPTRSASDELIRVMSERPAVTAVYTRNEGTYELAWQSSEPQTAWDETHVQPLLASMAAPHSADVIALLAPRATYGSRGDHGGATEESQRIPLIFAGPGVPQGVVRSDEARLVDVLPTIAALLGAEVTGYDGNVLRMED